MKYILLLFLCSCRVVANLQYAEIYYNPPLLEPLWKEVSDCSGIQSPIEAVTFYKVERIVGHNGEEDAGYWVEDGNMIFLAEDYKENPRVIKHEMMHAKLQNGNHPVKYFNGVCGNLIGVNP